MTELTAQTANQLAKVLDWYRQLTPDSVQLAGRFYHANARFKDPFNAVQGLNAVIRIFDHMFATTELPRFIMHDHIVEGRQAFISWTFEFKLRGKEYRVVGASHLQFDEQYLIIDHRDYWDAAEELLQKLPIVGGPIRWLRNQFAVPQKSL